MRIPFRLKPRQSLIEPSLLAGHPLLASIFGAVVLSACAQLPSASDASFANCIPRFEDSAGWYGADAAFSVPLSTGPERRTLWLFGDTFVERDPEPGRRSYPFIHNSIGLSVCDAQTGFELATYWRGQNGANPKAFFSPDPDAVWVRRAKLSVDKPAYYWPFDGFVFEGALYVGLLRVLPDEPKGPLRLPFRLAGMDLAQIENPADPPATWRITTQPLSDDLTLIPAAAFVLDNGYVYAFAFRQDSTGHSPRALTRFPVAALRSKQPLPAAFETLAKDGTWIAGIRAERAKILMADDATEMSVHRDEGRDRWLAVDSSPLTAGAALRKGNALRVRVSKSLAGPWSDPAPLYVIPETLPRPGSPPDLNLACYAGKAHAQFSSADSLAITYVCNLFAHSADEEWAVLARLAESPWFYRPIAAQVPIPALSGEAEDSRKGTQNGLP